MNLVMQQTNKNYDGPFPLTTGATKLFSGSKNNWFLIRCLKKKTKFNVDKYSV